MWDLIVHLKTIKKCSYKHMLYLSSSMRWNEFIILRTGDVTGEGF